MSPVKRSRKQRAAAARAASTSKSRDVPVEKDFMEDDRARFSAYFWTICLTFGYGFVNNLLLGRPENKVDSESVVVCVGTFVVQVIFFYGRSASAGKWSRLIERIWVVFQQLSQRRLTRFVGVSALVFVLLVSAIPLDTVKASLIKMLQTGRLPENVAQVAIQEVANLQNYKTLKHIAATDPATLRPFVSYPQIRGMKMDRPAAIQGRLGMVGQGIDKSTLILPPSAEALAYTHPIPMIFSDFTVVSYGHDLGKPIPQFLITTQGTSLDVVINNVKVVGVAQDIGNLTWTNDIFEGSVIRYHGGPLRLANVRFFNCTFERPLEVGGLKIFLDYLSTHQGEPVNAYFP
jgi:hypothetical protein